MNAVVPADELRAEVRRWADEILALSPMALRFVKQSFNADTEHLAGVGQLSFTGLGLFVESEEAQEGVRAFTRSAIPTSRPSASGSRREPRSLSTFDELKAKLAEIHYLGRARALLDWDEQRDGPRRGWGPSCDPTRAG